MIFARPVLLFILASALCVTAADAETIYRWVDDAGHVHFSDVVPDAYKKTATQVESTRFDPAPADKAAADARAAALKSAAGAIVVPTARASAPVPAPARQAAAGPVYDAANCKAWQKRFAQSKACFDGMTLSDSSLAPGAFRTCGDDVPNPYPTCGAPENYDVPDSGSQPMIIVPPHRRH